MLTDKELYILRESLCAGKFCDRPTDPLTREVLEKVAAMTEDQIRQQLVVHATTLVMAKQKEADDAAKALSDLQAKLT